MPKEKSKEFLSSEGFNKNVTEKRAKEIYYKAIKEWEQEKLKPLVVANIAKEMLKVFSNKIEDNEFRVDLMSGHEIKYYKDKEKTRSIEWIKKEIIENSYNYPQYT